MRIYVLFLQDLPTDSKLQISSRQKLTDECSFPVQLIHVGDELMGVKFHIIFAS